MRRLWLGLFLIAAASAVLLVADLKQRQPSRSSMPRVAILQHASQGIIDDGVRGIVDMLAEGGYIDRQSVSIQKFNAENDVATENAIARQLTSGSFDLVITATTLSLQTVANANRAGKVKHVFGLVSDPAGSGVGIQMGDFPAQPVHLTGLGTMQPVRETFELARRLNPGLKKVGVAWNPAEANSLAQVKLARTVTKDLGIELLEANIESSSAVAEACNSLASRGVEAIWVGGDVTALVAIDSIVGAAKRSRIPVFTSVPGNTKRGAVFDVGADYYQVGRLTGGLAVQVLKGASPGSIPVKNMVPEKLLFNPAALEGLKASWKIPQDLLDRAQAAAQSTPGLSKKWKLHLIELNNILDVEDAEHGILKGLEEAKLTKGKDFEITIRNAQGDMSTVNGLVDAAIAERTDMLITLSTPTLQAALQRSQGRVPIVFTYVASAIKAGAGTTNENHLPNVTGVTVVGAYDEIVRILHEHFPKIKRVGTLFVPAEVNMVFNKDELVRAAGQAGIEVVTMGGPPARKCPTLRWRWLAVASTHWFKSAAI